MQFYLESNGTGGLQTDTDTLVGTGTQNGTTWTVQLLDDGTESGHVHALRGRRGFIGATSTTASGDASR